MILQDLPTIGPSTTIEADLCIVGSGPAGWSIAEEFRNSGQKVLMLESGGIDRDSIADELNTSNVTGMPLFNTRARVLGGTSKLWNGRCVHFDDIDYEARSWVPLSGWPFGSDEVAPYLNRAAEHLGVAPYGHPDHAKRPTGFLPQLKTDPALLLPSRWANPAILDFGKLLLSRPHPDLRILTHATVTHLNTDTSGHQLTSVEVADPEGKRSTIRTRAVVLCAGGIENARILLYSNRIVPNGVGNQHDVVGRYFMDHPRDYELIARVDPSQAWLFRKLFGPYVIDTGNSRCEFSHGFTLSPDYQRREGLLNAAAWPFEIVAEDDPIEALKRIALQRRPPSIRDALRVASQPARLARGVHTRLMIKQRIQRKVERIGFLVSSEQTPNCDSRIQLSRQRDWLGLPITTTDWRVGSQEAKSQAAMAQLIAAQFQRLGLPPVRLSDWVHTAQFEDANFVDGCHPCGATRMTSDPRYGVVDANCKVHGVNGLYVAGSSIFPTNSHANPTLMIVALAVRLAKHLRQTLSLTSWQESGRKVMETAYSSISVDPTTIDAGV